MVLTIKLASSLLYVVEWLQGCGLVLFRRVALSVPVVGGRRKGLHC